MLLMLGCVGKDKPLDSIEAIWLWDTRQVLRKGKSVLDEAGKYYVNTIYLQIDKSIPLSDYQTFIREADAGGIEVHALHGAPSWICDEGEAERSIFYQWLTNYQANSTIKEAFTGIHLDIEPYLHASWEKERREAIKAYQKVMAEGKSMASMLDVTYGIDMPFWFDEVNLANKPLSHWLIDQADEVTIMAYRNQAKGPNGILALITDDVAYASEVDKKIIVGIETQASLEGAHVSFYGKSKQEIYEELWIVQENLQQAPSFKGFAIH